MTVFAGYYVKLATHQLATKMLGNELLIGNWKQPIRINTQHQSGDFDLAKRFFVTVPTATNIVGVHCLDQNYVAIGIKSSGELIAVKVQITFNCKSATLTQGTNTGLPTSVKSLV